ncbi:MAG: DUF1045 domain-containing protein [Ruegeria sp.]
MATQQEAEVTFVRYGIYFVPPPNEAWVKFATAWLGWDIETGSSEEQPVIDGLDIAAATKEPRKYGLHATLKPPFRMRSGQSLSALRLACAQVAASHAPTSLQGMEVTRLGRFLALRPIGSTSQLNAIAAACVRDLDHFRAPLAKAERERRRLHDLTMEQDANLTNWGYPYVLDSFRFHITLSGKLDKKTLAKVQTSLTERITPLLPTPFHIRELALVGEAEDGRFHMIHRYPLGA